MDAVELDVTRTALLVLHLQRDTIEPDGAFGAFFSAMIVRDRVLEHAAKAIEAARAAGVPVIYARVVLPAGYAGVDPGTPLNRAAIDTGALLAETPGSEIVDAVAPLPGELVVDHAGGTSAFRSPALAPALAERGIDTLLVAGVSMNVIVEGTVHDAINRDLRVFVVRDCCASADDATQAAALATLGMISHGLVTSDELVTTLRGGKA
jgi:nicotinamidase-related amidase